MTLSQQRKVFAFCIDMYFSRYDRLRSFWWPFWILYKLLQTLDISDAK